MRIKKVAVLSVGLALVLVYAGVLLLRRPAYTPVTKSEVETIEGVEDIKNEVTKEGKKGNMAEKKNGKETAVKEIIEEAAEFVPATALAKRHPHGNPLISHRFGADPHAMVYSDRVYVFMTNDILEFDSDGNVTYNSFGKINRLLVISSDDFRNWTDHGEIKVAGPKGAARWASHSWAPAIVHRVMDGKDRFFLYFSNNANGIGVLTSDSPLGPWVDPIGRPLISRSTPGVHGVVWLFDPAVLIDEDGNAYIYFGGGVPEGQEDMPNTARVMQLGEDMISVIGEAQTVPAPFMFEASGILKYNGIYFFSYCSNFYDGLRPPGSPQAGQIAYMTSVNPMGPWEYQGVILKNPWDFFRVGGNNHHNIFRFNNDWYIVYHAQTVAKEKGVAKGYRSPHINKVFFNEDSSIEDITGDFKGVPQIKNFDPYALVEAETFAWNAGILTKFVEGDDIERRVLTDIDSGDWIALSQVDFGEDGPSKFTASVSNITTDSIIELRLGGVDGRLIGTLPIPSNEGLPDAVNVTVEVSDVHGVHDLFLLFRGEPDMKLFDFDNWQFIPRL